MRRSFSILALLVLTGCEGYKIENGKWSWIEYNEGVGRMVVPVADADQGSFVPMDKEFARDRNHVYLDARAIPGADPDTFVYLGWYYGKDKNKVFRHLQEIEGADVETFRIVDGTKMWSRDKKDFYFGPYPVGAADADTFKVIADGWARDKTAYYAVPMFGKK